MFTKLLHNRRPILMILLVILGIQVNVAQTTNNERGIWVTGRNAEGQLGVGLTDGALTKLTHVPFNTDDVVSITAGEHQSYFLTTEGQLWASGANEYGQLGDGTTENHTSPVQVKDATEVIKIYAGRNHGLFIKTDKTLWAMGKNDYGQLGDGTNTDRHYPVLVAEQVVWAAAGEFHSMYITADGALWAVGRNNRGQLGDSTTNDRQYPVKIKEDVSRVYAGWLNSYYITTDGKLWATGDNSFGMLGIGVTQDVNDFISTPVQVIGGTGVEFVSAKSGHMYFVKTNRQLWSVGRNQFGQLGNGLRKDCETPVQVKNGTNVKTVAAGDGYGVFVRTDSTLWVMGNPAQGRMAFDGSDEQKMPLWAFSRYKGDVHNHSSYTWSHGAHRTTGSNWSAIKTGWTPPPGMGSGGQGGTFPPVLNPKGVIDKRYYSNFSGPPVYQMEKAKIKGYQFYVTSDHCHEEPFHPVDPVNNEFWEDIRETARNTSNDPNFTGLSGMEFSRNTDPQGTGTGHQVYINTHDYVSAAGTNALGYPQLYQWLKTARPLDDKGYVVLNFAHPDKTQYNDWAYWDSQIVDIATLCQITTVYNPNLDGWNRSLNKGWKTSPTGVQDSHGYWNMENRVPLTNILTTDLSAESLTRAMRQRRTYVSWTNKDDKTDTELRYSVNGYVMGSTLNKPDTFNFHIEIQTFVNLTNHNVRRIQILRNHPTNLDETQIVAEKIFSGTTSKVMWDTTIIDNDAKWFYLRVHHSADTNNDPLNLTYTTLGSTYSAPTWTGQGSFHGDGSQAIQHAVEALPIPVKASSGVAEIATGGSHTIVLTGSSQIPSLTPGIPASKSHGLEVYPNPASDYLEIIDTKEGNENLHLKLLDISGRVAKQWVTSGNKSKIGISEVMPGFYVLAMEENSIQVLISKVIINR